MKRHWTWVLLAAAAVMLGLPQVAEAQLAVRVQLYWEWSDGAWRPHRYEWNRARNAYYLPRPGVRMPPGHLPPPGYCREWIPGVPPGRQPRPFPCARLATRYGYVRPGAIIVAGPGYAAPPIRMERERLERRESRERRGLGRGHGSGHGRGHDRDR